MKLGPETTSKPGKKLNLGAGWRPIPGYINLDVAALKGIDLVHDLNKFPYPFKDNTFDEVCAFDVLEHLDDHIAVVKEIHRILKPGGKLRLMVPHWNSNGPTFDPTHKHSYGHTTFEYFCKGYRPEFHYYFDFQFSKLRRRIRFSGGLQFWNALIEPLANAFPMVYETTPFRMFPCEGIYAELIK